MPQDSYGSKTKRSTDYATSLSKNTTKRSASMKWHTPIIQISNLRLKILMDSNSKCTVTIILLVRHRDHITR